MKNNNNGQYNYKYNNNIKKIKMREQIDYGCILKAFMITKEIAFYSS